MSDQHRHSVPASVYCLVAALFFSCETRSPFELGDAESANPLTVMLFAVGDTSLVAESSVDSSSLTARDEEVFPGTLVVTRVKTDRASSRTSFTFSRVLMNDRTKPIVYQGKKIGYAGKDVGTVRLNSSSVPKLNRTLKVKGKPVVQVNSGVYYRSGEVSVQPNSDFTFQVSGGDSVSPFSVAVRIPPDVTVSFPTAQTHLYRDEDVPVRCSGLGGSALQIVVSGYRDATGEIGPPLVQMQVENPREPFKIPAKVLRLLPRGEYERFVFSFISLNRAEMSVAGYREKVLVQAATIHNIVLPVRDP